VYDELDALVARHPGLGNHNLQVRRRGSGSGMTFEGIGTGTQGRGTSYDAVLRSGEHVQLDDISPDGSIIDTKDWSRSPAEIKDIQSRWELRKEHRRRGTDLDPEDPHFDPSYKEIDFGLDEDAVRQRAEVTAKDSLETRLDTAQSEMTRQARFLEESGMPGEVVWRVNNKAWELPLNRVKKRVAPGLRRRIKIEIVE
jgi:hypothetical protein